MASNALLVEVVAGLPCVRFESPPSEAALAAINELVDEFGLDAVIDGDHDAMVFDPARVTVADIHRVLATLGP
ncbi:MAG: hypothetical protein AAGA99_12985 [Actinomycetota bacterium]